MVRGKDTLLLSVSELEISVRVANGLRHIGVKTVGDLVKLSRSDLLMTKNFGPRSLGELEVVLKAMGLKLMTDNKMICPKCNEQIDKK